MYDMSVLCVRNQLSVNVSRLRCIKMWILSLPPRRIRFRNEQSHIRSFGYGFRPHPHIVSLDGLFLNAEQTIEFEAKNWLA